MRKSNLADLTITIVAALLIGLAALFIVRQILSLNMPNRIQRKAMTPAKQAPAWCAYDSLRGAYRVNYPCAWTVVGTSTDSSVYLSPNAQAGFGISVNVGYTDAGLSHASDLGNPEGPTLAEIANVTAQKTTIRWMEGPGKGLIAEVIYSFQYNHVPYSVILSPSIENNAENLQTFGRVIATLHLK